MLHPGRHAEHAPKLSHDGSREARLPLLLVATGLAMFVVNLDFFALNLALPEIGRDLGVTVTDIQWVISGYMLALAAFMIPGGRLGDILGRRRMLVVGLVIFGASSAVCGAAPTAEILIAFRVVQGVGAAILFPLCIAVVTNAFPEESRKRAIGNLYGLAAVATAIGPFVGGGLSELIDWRAVLLLNVPLTAAAVVVTLRFVSESRDETVPRQIDIGGLAAVALGIAAITFAVDRTEEWGLASVATLGTLGVGALLLVVFVGIERRVPHPLIDLSLFRNVPYVVVTLTGTVANVAFCVATFASTLYLQQVEGHSPALAGAIFLAASMPLAIAGPLAGTLGGRYDIPSLMAGGIAVGSVGLLVVAVEVGLALYMAALMLFGIGYGLCWSLSSIGTQTVVPTEEAGAASGVTLAIVVGVAGLCVAIAAAVIDSLTADGTGLGGAIEGMLGVIAVGSALAAVALALFRRLHVPRPSPA